MTSENKVEVPTLKSAKKKEYEDSYLLDLNEIADYFTTSRKTIYRLYRAGHIKLYKLGRKTVAIRAEIISDMRTNVLKPVELDQPA